MPRSPSLARERGPALAALVALALSVGLVASPSASAAADPVASGRFKLRISDGFEARLVRNGVSLNLSKVKFHKGSLDPTSGEGKLELGKLLFSRGGKKVVFGRLRAVLGAGGRVKGSGGKLFDLGRGHVRRNGFGARVSRVRVKLRKSAARKLNRKLGLHSLHRSRVGRISFSEQPKTVRVESGEALVTPIPPPVLGGPAESVSAKVQYHCISPLVGVAPIAPATQDGAPTATFHFPAVGGTVGPAGNDGVVQLSGGVRLATGRSSSETTFVQPPSCPDLPMGSLPGPGVSTSYADITNLAPNLKLGNVQSNADLEGTLPGCWTPGNPPNCGVLPGNKGVAIGQTIDLSHATVQADPNSAPRTVTIQGAVIRNNSTSVQVLSLLFPNASGDPSNDLADGDLFGTADLLLEVR